MKEGVSVVVPAYNYGRFLRDSLGSILAQSHSNFELIVIDDGSIDDTRKIVSTFSDRRLRYIYQSNKGLSAARNTGIANAKFPFIAFLDADDTWYPEMLSAALNQFARSQPNDALIAFGSVRMRVDGTPIDLVQQRCTSDSFTEIKAQDIVIKSRFMPSAVVVKRAVFEAVGLFDTALRSSEDRDMWIRIAAKYQIRFCSRPLARIRKHPDNMSKNADRMRVNMRNVLRKYFHGPSKWYREPITLLKAYGFHHFEVAWMYFDENRVSHAIVSLLTSLAIWPVFWNPRANLGPPPLFRIRALVRFTLSLFGVNWS